MANKTAYLFSNAATAKRFNQQDAEFKLLAQLSPAVANTPETLFSPAAGEEVHITTWSLANYNNKDVSFIVYVDDDGTTYDDSTTARVGMSAKDTTDPLAIVPIYMNNENGSIGFKASDTDVTLTIWGAVYTKKT
jgi:hypothetical protein